MTEITEFRDVEPSKVTERINASAFELLEQNSDGLRWTELRPRIEGLRSRLSPQDGQWMCLELAERYPDRIRKASKGLFRL